MKKSRFTRILPLIFAAALLLAGPMPSRAEDKKPAPAAAEAKKPNPDRVVAKVNGSPITEGRYMRALAMVGQQLAQSGRRIPQEALPQLQRQVLENLVKTELLYLEAKKAGMKVSAEEVEKATVEMRSKFSSPEQFDEWLKRGDLTMEQLKVEETKSLEVRKFIDENFTPKATVTEDDVKKYYKDHPDEFKKPERVHARHILVTVDEKASDLDKAKARKKIDELAARLKKGDDFATVAREGSDCPSKARGGDLGYFERGRMVEPFEKAAFALKTDETSAVVETQFGYHIIQVLDKTPEETVPLDQVKEPLMGRMKSEKVNELVSKFVDDALAKANVEYTKE